MECQNDTMMSSSVKTPKTAIAQALNDIKRSIREWDDYRIKDICAPPNWLENILRCTFDVIETHGDKVKQLLLEEGSGNNSVGHNRILLMARLSQLSSASFRDSWMFFVFAYWLMLICGCHYDE